MDLSRFQDLERLEPGALRISMIDVLSRERALARTSRERLEDAVDSLINDGFGVRMSESTARRQAMLISAGVLLRLAGASVQAIRTELEHRDDAALEGVMDALLSRMRGPSDNAGRSQAPSVESAPVSGHSPNPPRPAVVTDAGRPGVAASASSSSGPGSPASDHTPPIDSSPNAAVMRPASVGSAPNIPRSAANAPTVTVGGRENPALRFLNGLITDDIAALIRRANTATSVEGPLESLPVAARAWIELSVGEGVRFELTEDTLRGLADSRRREALVGAIRARLDALYG